VLIDELMKNGVKFIACGQAMNFFEVKQEDMVPNIRISLTAQTVLSNYQLKGFVLYPITSR
jgi:predicted peroxiredoxin